MQKVNRDIQIGFVGAAMASAVAQSRDSQNKCRYNVIGVELPTREGKRRVDAINSGKFPLNTVDNELMLATKNGVVEGNLSATTDQTIYQNAQVVIVDVALDISTTRDSPAIDFRILEEAIRTIGLSISANTLIIVETTVAPGTCERVIVPILHEECEKRGISKDSIQIAHSYERVMPGEKYLDSIVNYWRVYAGYTEEAACFCGKFLETIINTKEFPLTKLSTMSASETAKIMENSYRATNIAFIDEWSKFAESIEVDLHEVIRAIAIRPTHSNIRYPGVGVGGYCLTKDPMFAPAAAKQLFGLSELSFPFIDLTKKVNQEMPKHVIACLEQILTNGLVGKEIVIFGVSYRPDIGDSRYSPTETLVKELKRRGATALINDPLLEYWEEMKIKVPEKLPSRRIDGAILAVGHTDYQDQKIFDWLLKYTSAIVDAVDLLSTQQRTKLRESGIRVYKIGSGSNI